MSLRDNEIERYSRQIILKDIGINGQKKLKKSKVLIIGLGGLGCPAAEYLSRAGVGTIGLIDHDRVSLSNIHRQSIFTASDIKKYKIDVVKQRIKKVNPHVNIKSFKKKIEDFNIKKIIKSFDIVIDGTDNFSSKFLINKFSKILKKVFISGAIGKFDGHIFGFNFSKKTKPCLESFYQGIPNNIATCEEDGVIGTVAGVVGNIQANEAIKYILNVGKCLNGKVLIINLLNLEFKICNLIK
tara:strand:- start:656 stop:1378 length:723 start_codon:yes stop_codon:yes gene_type:complete